MRVDNLTKEILELLGNNHTKVKVSNEYNSNYYNFLTDTIYLTSNINKIKRVKGLENANPFCGNLVTICHECIHSVQDRRLHILNLILSNLSIALTIISLILMFLLGKTLYFVIISAIIIIDTILIRLTLEAQAITKSIWLANKAIQKINIEKVQKDDVEQAKSIIKKLMPLQIVHMIFDKIIMLVIVVI